MEKIRLGIIGPGLIWEKSHEPVLKEMSDFFAISAFSATSQKSEEKVKKKYPDLPFYYDCGDLLASPDIDAVVIMTPIKLNAEIAKAALLAGKMVFVEKPFCLNVDEGIEIVSISRQANLPVFVLEQVVYDPALKQINKAITEGSLGTPVSFDVKSHFRMMNSSDPSNFSSTGWRQNPDFPLGTLTDGGIHDLAKLSTIFGSPMSVTATGRKLREDFGEYDHVLLLLEYENGISGTLSHSGFMPACFGMSIYGTDGTCLISGGKTTIKRLEKKETEFELTSVDSHRLMWRHFKECIQLGREPAYPAEQALGDVRLLNAIRKSIHSKQKITV